MKKIYYSLTVLIVSILTLNTSEIQAQCAKSIFQASNLGTPPCGTDAQTSVGSGQFVTMQVVAGAQYCISTCGTGWNTQLTGYNGNSAVFFNDNNGPFCQSNEASVQWIATFTGSLDVMVNRFNCQGYQGGGTANSSILKYRQCSPTITSSNADMCPAQCITLTSDQSGGTWSISPNDGSLTGNQFCPIATGVYTISYTLAACVITQTINVVTPSVAPTSAIANPASLCPGGVGAISVIGGSLGTNAQWVWYAGGCGAPNPIVGVGATITGQPPVTATYYVQAEGGCAPTACATVTVPVNTLSTAPTSVSATTTSVCQGSSTTLTVNGGSLGSASNWYWYNGACGGVLVGSGQSITVNPLSSTVYYVRAEGPCNITTCASITINVSQAPEISFNFITTPSACGASDGSISVYGSGGTGNYNWTLNNIPSTPLMTNLSAGPYVIRVIDQNGCQDVVTVSMNDPGATPATVVSSDPDNIICQGDYVTFTASGSYLYTYYVNGVPVSTANPWTTNSLNNGDIVHVQALDFNFCSYTPPAITMTVNPNPVVTLTSNNPTVCGLNDGDVSTNVSGGLPPYYYTWSHDGTLPPSTSVAYNLVAGPYFVTVGDQNGCTTMAVAALSDPGASPVTLISSDDDSLICSGENVDFTASGSVDYTFYLSGPIVQGPGTNNVYSTTALVDGDIMIATGTDINGCTATSNYFTTSVIPSPNVGIISSDPDNTICTGTMVTFTGVGALFYQFFINGVSQGPPGTNNVIQSNTLVHGDVITVEGTDANHCVVMSSGITMTVNPPPSVSITLQQDPSSCGASDGLLIVTAVGGTSPYTYVWNQDVTHTTYADAPNITGLVAAPYHVNVTDAEGCSGDVTASLSDVGSSPVFISSSTDPNNIICAGQAVTLTGSGATTYVFYVDGVVVSTNNPYTTTTLQDGQSVAVVGLDTTLCAATSSVIDFVVNPSPFLQIGVVTPPSACGLSDGSITSNTYGGTLPYSWTWNGGLPDAPDNTGIPAGPYTVIVTDANGCTDQASASLSDIGAPLAVISMSEPDLLICQGDTVNFTGAASGGTPGYVFNFYVNGPPAIPGTPDTYSNSTLANNDVVAVTATDVNGCTGTSQTLTFAVTPVVIPTISTLPDVCEHVDQLSLPGLGGESPSGGTFTVDYNGNSIISDLFFPYGIGAGTHPIVYTLDNGNGCFTTATADITVLPAPVIDLGADFAICDSAIIVAPGGYVDYDWFPSDLVILDDSTVVIYNSAHVTVDVTNTAGCIGTGEVNAVINHPPILEIVTSPVGAPTEICMGDTVTLCVVGNWASIVWTTGSANVSCIDVYQNNNVGVYAEDPNGCADEILEGQGMVVTVHNPQPTITVNVDDLISSGGYINYQWYYDGSPITTNGNYQTYNAALGGTGSGNYYVEVTDQWGCIGQSSVIEHSCVCVGIEEAEVNYNLNIFPNPTNGIFTVNLEFESAVDMRLELTNILGQPVLNVEDVKNTQTLRRDYNLNHLAQGIYIFTIRTGEQTIVRRVVKN